MRDEPQEWPVHDSVDLWRGTGPFSVRRDLISAPGDPEQFWRMVVEHPGAVCVLAVDDDEQVLVLQQYRHPIGTRLVQLPAGLLDDPTEDPVVAGQRELLEEGATEAARWRPLNTIHTSPGINSERIEIFLATGITHVPDRGGFELAHEEADMTAHWVPFEELLRGVLARELTDGPLVTAVTTYSVLRNQGAL